MRYINILFIYGFDDMSESNVVDNDFGYFREMLFVLFFNFYGVYVNFFI